MATKKASKNKKSSKKSNKAAAAQSELLVADIEKLIKKHDFNGAVTLKIKATAESNCPEGSSWQPRSVQKPDGSIETKWRCVKD